jgi:hypothetical protein
VLIIKHRINTLKELMDVPTHFGVEVDIRSNEQKLLMSHDPFSNGEDFETWLKFWNHKFLVVNIKEEGLEESISELLSKYGISNYFFLDQSFPFLVKYARKGVMEQALRVSEYENIADATSLAINWLWLDSFTGNWNYLSNLRHYILNGNYKLCLVSPELHGRNLQGEIPRLKSFLDELGLEIDAVCTKNESLWDD